MEDVVKKVEARDEEGQTTMVNDLKMNSPNDPLEGFEVSDYDPATGRLTIKIHRTILNDPRSRDALAQKMVEILERWPGVDAVDVVPRK